MSTENKPEEKKDEAAPPAKKGGAIGGIVMIIVPAILSAGAAYGGTRAAPHGASAAPAAAPAPVEEKKHVVRPPGPTLALDPFLVTLSDAKGKTHPMKLTLAVEFEDEPGKKKGGEEGGNETDEFKGFVPRMRDSILNMLRQRTYEEMTDTEKTEKFREEILDKVQKSGAKTAEKILVTDMVIQ